MSQQVKVRGIVFVPSNLSFKLLSTKNYTNFEFVA